MTTIRIPAWLLLCALVVTAGCGGSSGSNSDSGPTRSFAMGFTPWPYAGTAAAVVDTYTRIQTHGDIVAHHIMDGIPWDEALAGTPPWPPDIETAIQGRLDQTLASQRVYLAVDALNSGRDGLANDWDGSCVSPLCAPWDGYAFDHPDVITAYTNFALDLIDRFDPDYFSFGSEASELLLNNATTFDEFVDFSEAVIANIRAMHPDLPILVSVALKAPGSTDTDKLVDNLGPLIDHVDMVGISVYPYAFFNPQVEDPGNLPADWLSQIEDVSQGKPLAVTETGWIGEDLSISSYQLNVSSSSARQDAFIDRLFTEANDLDVRFVIWFTVVDYDDLWENELGMDPLARIWRDTGLYDEDMVPRAGLMTWDRMLEREID